jgi:APA family basic amino acid/polyamine antiporter
VLTSRHFDCELRSGQPFLLQQVIGNDFDAAPFSDAAHTLGKFGGPMIVVGALVATAGSLNGNILLSGQMPAAVTSDGLAPAVLAKKNADHAPTRALVTSSGVATLLLFNYSDGLVSAFTFLI